MPRKLFKDYSFYSPLYRLSQTVEHPFDLKITLFVSVARSQYVMGREF
ncbi:MAG: hypothetical protein HOK18_07225 [Porticoccaceae bacterium]|nr:hypothetical protein [Porticoccaceae bacterium]MBT6693925.1 hypothetical protein [Porticoccaceae bacterium]MBT7751990.1 hypothetical protein [Porticoccaceae bacterium]